MKRYITSVIFSLLFLHLSAKEKCIDISYLEDFRNVASTSIIIEDSKDKLLPGDAIDYFIRAQWSDSSGNTIPNVNFTTSTFWQIIKVCNPSEFENDYLIQLARPLTNVVELYQYDSKGQFIQSQITGDNLVYESRPIFDKDFIFPFKLKANESQYLIAKLKSDGEVLTLSMKIWENDAYISFISKHNLFQGFYYGLLLFVALFFIFVGIALNQRLYFYFVAYVSLLFFMQFSIDGYAFRYLWPNNTWFANHAIVIFATSSVIFLLTYVRAFLQLYKGLFNKLFSVFIFLLFICLGLGFMSNSWYEISFPLINILAFLSSFLFLVGVFINYKESKKLDLAFTLAFISVLIGGITFILINVGVFESDFLKENAIKIGSAFEIGFLSIAMAGRYRDVQLQKEQAQQEAYDRLDEISKIKQEQNVYLEEQVTFRTQEISLKNDELSKKNREIIDSINYAERLEDSILPTKTNFLKGFQDGFILYVPKDIVSGDFYFREDIGEYSIIAVADCTGHGVPGAMLSIVGHNSLNRCINQYGLRESDAILNRLTEMVEELFSKGKKQIQDGMDISLIVLNNQTKTLQFSGAFNGLYLIRNNELIEFKGNKQPVGHFFKRVPFKKEIIQLEENDCLYMTSDGYPDQFGGPRDKKLKIKVLKDLFLDNHTKSGKDQLELLSNYFFEWKGNKEQIDDVCVVGIKV